MLLSLILTHKKMDLKLFIEIRYIFINDNLSIMLIKILFYFFLLSKKHNNTCPILNKWI